MKRPAARGLRVTAMVLATLTAVLILFLLLVDWNWLKHPIERVASAKSGRTVAISGALNVKIWSLTPTVIINGLTVGGTTSDSARPMAKIERLEIHLKLLPLLKGDVILPRVVILAPDVYLHQAKNGAANWSVESKLPTDEPAPKPTKLPVIRDLLIQDGKLQVVDELRHLRLSGTIQAHERRSDTDPTPFRIAGTGTLNNQRFEMRIAGGALLNLSPDTPYPFDLHVAAGNLRVDSKGRVIKPFDLGKLDLSMDVSGKDLAEGFYLTQLALPNTAPFKLHAHVVRDGKQVRVTEIAGAVGQSDLRGTLDIDVRRKRPYVSGDLVSKRLRLKDLAASLGKRVPESESLDPVKVTVTQSSPASRLFSDSHLQVDRVRAMDADVKFRATSIDAGTVPFKAVAFTIALKEGVIRLDPVAFEMPQGQLTGLAVIDARQDVPSVHIDMRIKDVQLAQLKGKKPDSVAPLVGQLQARAVVDGTGDSAHQVVSTANGRFTAILPEGQITAAFAELTGINISKGLALLLTKQDAKAPIRCGVAQFTIDSGRMNAEKIVFDTRDVVINGSGSIHLDTEELHLQIKGEPKKLRLARLRAPIEIRGHLADPSVGVSVPKTVKQGAVATALGAIVAPLAAVIAFVDPGLAKDQNCAAMIADADARGPKVPSPHPTAARP